MSLKRRENLTIQCNVGNCLALFLFCRKTFQKHVFLPEPIACHEICDLQHLKYVARVDRDVSKVRLNGIDSMVNCFALHRRGMGL